jgi:hypothetical protein
LFACKFAVCCADAELVNVILRFIFHSVVGIVIFYVLKSFKNNDNNDDSVNNNKSNTTTSKTPDDNDYVQPGAPATLYGGRAQQSGYDIIDPPNSTQY